MSTLLSYGVGARMGLYEASPAVPSILHTSNLSDPHLMRAMKEYAEEHNLSFKDVLAEATAEVNRQTEEMLGYSLATDIIRNLPEQVVFDKYVRVDPRDLEPENFKVIKNVINDLVVTIMIEMGLYRGLINNRNPRGKRPVFVFTPDDFYQSLTDVTTAAITPKGEVAISKDWALRCLRLGRYKGINGPGPKYQGNPGKYTTKYPPNYAYLEFAIRHEFSHYLDDDFFFMEEIGRHYAKKYKTSVDFIIKSVNWAADFRINYRLVEMGLPQLPMGLFSERFNLENPEWGGEWKNLLEKVIEERLAWAKKHPPKKQPPGGQPPPPGGDGVPSDGESDESDEGNDPLDGLTDDHHVSQSEENKDKKDEPKGPGQGPKDDNDPNKKDEPKGPGKGPGKDNDPNKEDGSGGDGGEPELSDEEFYRRLKKAQEKFDKRDKETKKLTEKGDEQILADNEAAAEKARKNQVGNYNTNKASSTLSSLGAVKEIRPPINWRALLSKFFETPSGITTSYFGNSRKQLTQNLSANQKKADLGYTTQVITQNEVPDEKKKKIAVIVLDCSGSMGSAINEITRQIVELIKTRQRYLSEVYFIRFSDHFQVYSINLKDATATEVERNGSVVTNGATESVDKVIRKTFNGGTTFSAKVYDCVIRTMGRSGNAKKGVSVLLITDSDMYNVPENLVHSNKLLQGLKTQLKILFASGGDYEGCIRKACYPNHKADQISCIFPDDKNAVTSKKT